MAGATAIEWTNATWNPVSGCTKISTGCDNCYAERFSERFRGVARRPFSMGFDLTLRPERLEQPLRWRRPRMIFVNSMSDLFHKLIPFDFVDGVFDVWKPRVGIRSRSLRSEARECETMFGAATGILARRVMSGWEFP